jgi:hypothetical protein
MKTQKLDVAPAAPPGALPGSTVRRLSKPESGARAEMLEGAPEEVADKLVAILKDRGLVRS